MSENDTDQSIRCRIMRKFCVHEWSYVWSGREKTCIDCGEVQEITKEYIHNDESAEIGDTRLRVDRSGDLYAIDKQRYRWAGHGEDFAEFNWFPVESISLTQSGIDELLEKLDRSVDTGTDQ